MRRIVVGLDLSYTSTGVAVLRDGAFDPASSTVLKTAPDKARPYDSIRRAQAVASAITTLLDTLSLAANGSGLHVFIEGYAFGSFANRERLGELGGIVKTALLRNGFEYQLLTVTQVRKFVCGKGNARKDLVMQSLLKRYALDITQNDMADAVALAKTGDYVVLDAARQLERETLYADARAVLEAIVKKGTRLESI